MRALSVLAGLGSVLTAHAFLPTSGSAAQVYGPDRVAQEVVQLTARIVDSGNGRPLIGAIVQLSGISERWVTGTDGEVEFEVPVGEYLLYAERSGYERLEGDFEVFRPGSFTLRLTEIDLDDPWAPGRLFGTIVDTDTGQPLEGVEVSILPRGRSITDERGRFLFEGINPGLNRMTVKRLGYSEREEPVTVQPGRTTAVEVELSVEAIELPAITVEVRDPRLEIAGVYRRMDRGTSGQFVTRAAIEARVSPDLSDSFHDVPGVQVIGTGTFKSLFGRGNCKMRILVDGIEVGVGMDGFVNINDFPPEWVEMAEVYSGPAATPIEYSRPLDDCGVVLLWSRRTGSR